MSQKLEILHKQTINNLAFLINPYPIVQTFIKHNNILTSDRLWIQLFKIISISVQIQIEEIIGYCTQSSDQTSLDAINNKLIVMGVLGLLIITWIRLGRIVSSQSTHTENDKVKVFLTIDSEGTQINKFIIIQIRSKVKLKKDQICIVLYDLLKNLCKRHLFQLQMIQKLDKIYLKGENLRYDDLSFPFTLQFSLSGNQTANKIIISNDELQQMNQGISLLQYVKFLKYFNNIPSLGVISLQNFFDLYCRKIEQLIQISHEKSDYNFMLSPRNILIIQYSQRKQLKFYINVKSHFLQVQNKIIMPAGADKLMQFDKSLSQHKKPYDMQLRSAGLCILAVLAEWQSLQYFENYYQAIEKKGLSAMFIKKQVQKLQENRDIATHFNINKLKAWLKISQINLNKNEEDEWQTYLKKIKNTQKLYRNQVERIFGIKMTQQNMRFFKLKLFKDKNFYKQLGYQNKERIRQSASPCLNCRSIRQKISGNCEHSYCLTCYKDYIQQKFIDQNYQFLICPSLNCDRVLSQQIMQAVLSDQKFSSKYKQTFLTKLMNLHVLNNKDSFLRHCLCAQQSSFFQINQKTEMFLCDHCNSFICIHCLKKFHGSIACQHSSVKNGSFYLQIKRRLQGFYQTKKIADLKNKKSIQESLLTQFSVANLKMIQELQATLVACLAQVYSLKITKVVKTQNLLIIQQAIEKICIHLTNFYCEFSDTSQTKNEKQSTKTQEIHYNICQIQQFHELGPTILYLSRI